MKKNSFRWWKRAGSMILTVMMILALAGCSGSSDTSSDTADGEISQDEQESESQTHVTSKESGTGSSNYDEEAERQYGGKVVNVESFFNGFFAPQSQTTAMAVCWPCLETLAYQTSDGTWNPRLAESWDIDREAYTVTLYLRQGVYFHNGDPFDADDVVFTLSSRFDYGTASNIGSPSSIEKVDDYTVVVTYDEFSLNYEAWLFPQFMYSKETYEEMGEDYMITNVIGTGPYYMTEYVPDDHLTYERYEDYWGEPGYPDSFTWVIIQDTTAQAAAFINGEVDRISANSSSLLKILEDEGYTGVSASGDAGTQQYIIPITLDDDAPLSVQEIRQAIYQYGIDWDSLAESLGGGAYFHTDAYGMTGNSYYSEELEFTTGPDYEKAKQMISDAGYPDGFTLEIYYSSSGTDGASIATYVQAELAKIGVTAECVPVDSTVLASEYATGSAAQTGLYVTGLYYTPLQTQRLNQMNGPTGTQSGITNWSDELVELFNNINAAQSMDEQDQAMRAFVTQWIQVESLYWPVWNTSTVEFYQEWLHYGENARIGNAGFDPREIWVDQE